MDSVLALVVKYARTDTDEIDVKDQKQKNIARNELPEEYRKQADYFHLSNGVLMYRDILNDEWLTDAVVERHSRVSLIANGSRNSKVSTSGAAPSL